MKRIIIWITVLVLCLNLGGCSTQSHKSPVTDITLDMTLAEVLEHEPELLTEDDSTYTCKKAFAGEEGTLLIRLSLPEDGSSTKTVSSIVWDLRPDNGSGKAVYDSLYSSLKQNYGKPKQSRNNKNVKAVTGEYDEAGALWNLDGRKVSCSYIEYHKTGMCQVLFEESIKLSLTFKN